MTTSARGLKCVTPCHPRSAVTRQKRFVFNAVCQCVSCVSNIMVAAKRLFERAVAGNSTFSQINNLHPSHVTQLTQIR
jgi:hypothetical protein